MSDPNSHVTQLSNGLRQLEIQQADAHDDQHPDQTSPTSAVGARGSSRPPIRDGYGFRSSGVNTPNEIKDSRSSPLPDPNGLGWPGAAFARCWKPAKSTVMRLNATDAERAIRDQKLHSAVRTILECIGEDPAREGLLRTPERYAKALLWMTKGYEERLAGSSGPTPIIGYECAQSSQMIDVINDAVFAEDHDEMVLEKFVPCQTFAAET
ncbi:hypothetical protein CCMSSC00406_0001705 [Pleurotus cornucopiae]|uniref:Uncharacterized protein n=1 Tax=Pleurotus cornucopiae TaxID=5321 RepID=A0ACB7IMZ3_PLECO|nr:hypothetical protein CCMSSC00406_0001705 [Pleurotus cornucopiae]